MNSAPTAAPAGNTWFYFTLITVFSWGVYGILLHKGQMAMNDPANGRYKAFLFVGIAYFLTAVLAPLFLLMSKRRGLQRLHHARLELVADRRKSWARSGRSARCSPSGPKATRPR